MRLPYFAVPAVILAAVACKESTAPVMVAPTFHLSASVSGTGDCAVTALGHNYISRNAQRGDVGAMFIGTVPTEQYHGVGCWVGTSGGDGDLIVIFSGNNLGKPLAVGTYALNREILNDLPLMRASVTFRNSEMPGDKLVSLDGAVGSVKVESTDSGGRIITVDAELTRWRTSAF